MLKCRLYLILCGGPLSLSVQSNISSFEKILQHGYSFGIMLANVSVSPSFVDLRGSIYINAFSKCLHNVRCEHSAKTRQT